LRERDDGKRERAKQQRKLQSAPKTIDSSSQSREQAAGYEFLDAPRTSAFRAQENQNEKRDNEQGPKPLWCPERQRVHGNFFQMVSERRTCVRSKPQPAMMQIGNKSRYC